MRGYAEAECHNLSTQNVETYQQYLAVCHDRHQTSTACDDDSSTMDPSPTLALGGTGEDCDWMMTAIWDLFLLPSLSSFLVMVSRTSAPNNLPFALPGT